MSYARVIPRDLFNESKLLKCLGQLALNLHDRVANIDIELEHDNSSFEIEQDESTGDLYCSSLALISNGESVGGLYCSYNSRAPYPLYLQTCDADMLDVFNDDGSFSQSFIDFFTRQNLPVNHAEHSAA